MAMKLCVFEWVCVHARMCEKSFCDSGTFFEREELNKSEYLLPQTEQIHIDCKHTFSSIGGHRTKICCFYISVKLNASELFGGFLWAYLCAAKESGTILFSNKSACETSAPPSCLFQWSCWSLNFEKHKSSFLCFLSTTLIVHHALFVSVVNDTGRALHFIVAVLHFFPSSPNPAASLLRGLCMNSHCHVQGRVAQGQLIAFMIMISRQIYRACSEHIFQVLPTLLAQMGKMSLQLLAVTSCLSAGHTFWLIRVERRGWITQAFPVKALISFSVTVLVFLIFGHKRAFLDFVFSMIWSLEVMSKEWHRQRFWVFSAVWTFLWAINLSSLFLCTDEIITLTLLMVCQNYQSTSFWCWWLFFLRFLPPLWKWWAQMSPTHFIHFIYFVVSLSCAELDQIFTDNRILIFDSEESFWFSVKLKKRKKKLLSEYANNTHILCR